LSEIYRVNPMSI